MLAYYKLAETSHRISRTRHRKSKVKGLANRFLVNIQCELGIQGEQVEKDDDEQEYLSCALPSNIKTSNLNLIQKI